jgi:hypothetical protein
MREKALRDFFEGKLSAAELERDIAGSTKTTKTSGPKTTIVSIEDMDTDCVVTADMGVRLCDAVLNWELTPEALQTIGFALMASDKFHWNADDDEVLANIIADWSCPEINYPLTVENVHRFRAWLMRTEAYPAKLALTSAKGKIVSVTKKNPIGSRGRIKVP